MKRRNLIVSVIGAVFGFFFTRRGEAGYTPDSWTPWEALEDIVTKYNNFSPLRWKSGSILKPHKLTKCRYLHGTSLLDEDELRHKIDRSLGEVAFVAVFYREPLPEYDAEMRTLIKSEKAKGTW